MRILFIGSNWYGSNARSCADSLRRLGHEVQDIDHDLFFPELKRFSSKAGLRLANFRLVDEFNDAVLRTAAHFPHDIFLAFLGSHLKAATLRTLRRPGVSLYNYFPDTSAFAHGDWLISSLPEYDCVFYTKPFWYDDATKHIPLKKGQFLPHGYDPLLHRPFDLDPRDIRDYRCDVSFIATYYPHKEKVLAGLVRLRPDIDLRIWGNQWTTRSKVPELRRCIQGFPLFGESYSRAIRAARISLAIMSGRVAGASSGDLTTSRTYTIPASGGFMLHERNDEVHELYREGEEIACFDSAEELAAKIDYYLGHPEERDEVARAGHERCVPRYSYDNRMAELLRWHYAYRDAAPQPEAFTRY